MHQVPHRNHPRECGAHKAERNPMLPFAGSSPRVRGLTTGASPAPAPCRDHPRGCGAHTPMRLLRTYFVGSSPRVRGSLYFSIGLRYFRGIIPAGAGLTGFSCGKSSSPGDHPRGCGAHENLACTATFDEGSSPRVRGSQRQGHVADIDAGIIPAGAGLTRKV